MTNYQPKHKIFSDGLYRGDWWEWKINDILLACQNEKNYLSWWVEFYEVAWKYEEVIKYKNMSS